MSERATAFHANHWEGVLFVTGGGTPFLAEMISTPGASGTVLDAQVPYAERALTELLSGKPEQACSEATARQLAMAAFTRAKSLSDGSHLFGLGCTAGLATNRPKKGIHRAHWAIQTATTTTTFYAEFNSDRAGEEAELNDHLWSSLQTVLEAEDIDHPHVANHAAPEPHLHLLWDEAPTHITLHAAEHKLLLPGSFNPAHDGHHSMLAFAETITGLPGAFELTVKNADKPSLDFITLNERVAALAGKPLVLTNVSTYVEKARLFPGATFVLGIDTITRIADPRFYAHREDLVAAAIAEMAALNTRFLVFGRKVGEAFLTLDEVVLPGDLLALCMGVAEEEYRLDLSSSDLRASSELPEDRDS